MENYYRKKAIKMALEMVIYQVKRKFTDSGIQSA